VVIFNEAFGKVAQNYLKKGSTVYIEGQLQTRKWTDNAGVEKYSTEVVLQKYQGELTMLGSKGDSNAQSSSHQNQDGAGGGQNLDDEIPF